MINRRDVLKLGAAAAGSAWLVAHAEAARARLYADRGVLAAAVISSNVPAAAAFATVLAGAGIPVFAAGSDVSTLWYPQLRDRLRRIPAPLAGLTDRTTLFCLEELARDVGGRVQYRIEHLFGGDGTVRHDAAGAEPIVRAAAALGRDAGFGVDTAVLAVEQAKAGAVALEAQRRFGPGTPASPRSLVSWVIS